MIHKSGKNEKKEQEKKGRKKRQQSTVICNKLCMQQTPKQYKIVLSQEGCSYQCF